MWAAAQFGRWAPAAREAKPRGNPPDQEARLHLGGRLSTRGSPPTRDSAPPSRPGPRRTAGCPPRHGRAEGGACTRHGRLDRSDRPCVPPGRWGRVPQGRRGAPPGWRPRAAGVGGVAGVPALDQRRGVAVRARGARATAGGAWCPGGGARVRHGGSGQGERARRVAGGRSRPPRPCPAPRGTEARRVGPTRWGAPKACGRGPAGGGRPVGRGRPGVPRCQH